MPDVKDPDATKRLLKEAVPEAEVAQFGTSITNSNVGALAVGDAAQAAGTMNLPGMNFENVGTVIVAAAAHGPLATRTAPPSEQKPMQGQALPELGAQLLPRTASEGTPGPHKSYGSFRDALEDMGQFCRQATDIKILANKGLPFIGTDDSVVSTAEIDAYGSLRKLRVLLMSPDSRWITKGLIALRKHESLPIYLNEIEATHRIVESGFRKFAARLVGARSGVKYFTGEPCWRMLITDATAFVSSYADDRVVQVRDLPVCRFDNVPGSFYSAFKRNFNNLWHNESVFGEFMRETLDLATSAGGIVHAVASRRDYILLLRRHDGSA